MTDKLADAIVELEKAHMAASEANARVVRAKKVLVEEYDATEEDITAILVGRWAGF